MEIFLSIATLIVITVSFGIVVDFIYRIFNPPVEKQSWLKRVTSIIWGSFYGLLSGILAGTTLLIVGFFLAFVLTNLFLYLFNGEIVDIRELDPLTMFEIVNPLKWWAGDPWRVLPTLIIATVVVLCLGKFKLSHLNRNEPLNGADLNSGSKASI